MKTGEFGKELKRWRGSRLQKNAADLLGVNLRTYEGWENGRQPSRYVINLLRRQMEQTKETK